MSTHFTTACILALLTLTVNADTTIHVSSTTKVAGVRRFGINTETLGYFDSRQMFKDFAFVRNGNFEGLIFQSVVRCGPGGTAASAIEDQSSTQWPSGFWAGASYEFVFGAASGRSGTIAHSLAPNRVQTPNDPLGSAQGTTYQFADTDATKVPASGDCLILRKSVVGDASTGGAATTNWTVTAAGGGTLISETSDLPPGTPGRQCVRLSAASAGQTASLSTSFDGVGGVSFVSLNGAFRLSFKAKGVGGSHALNVQSRRGTGAYWVNQVVPLTTSWSDYQIDFTANDDGAQTSPVSIVFAAVNQSAVLLDDVSLLQTNGDASNTTPFRDAVLTALRELNPGILRGWFGQLGDTLDNQLAVPGARQRSAYSSFGTSHPLKIMGLHDLLTLCEAIGADPWYVVPATFSTQEATQLMEYLGGSTATPYGAKRAALGHATPWTSVFSRIHLELGNENWNSIFRGGTFAHPVAYGTRGGVIFSTMKSSPHYSSGQFTLVLGAQATNTGPALQIHNASASHDSLSLAPYMNSRPLNSFGTNEEYYGALFAEPEWWSRNPTGTTGFMRTTYNNIQASARPVPLSIYETNVHPTQGTITQAALDTFVPSLGTGLAVADHMLLMLCDMSLRDQVLFSLGGYRYTRADAKTVAVWGAVRDMGVTDRKRPQFLALKMINQALSGNMVTTSHSGDDPTWAQPLVNNISVAAAHHVQSYAFSNGADKSLIVFNLHRTDPLGVNFTGANAPAGTLARQLLTSANLTDTNESAQNVSITSSTLTNFDPSASYTLPPFSMTLFKWTQPAVDAWRHTHFGTTSNTGNAADTADPYGTGLQNLIVFALLGPAQNPALASTVQLPQPQLIGGQYTYSFTQPAGVSGITYGAEWSTSLAPGSWQPVPDTGAGSTHTFSLPATGQPRMFMRLTGTRL